MTSVQLTRNPSLLQPNVQHLADHGRPLRPKARVILTPVLHFRQHPNKTGFRTRLLLRLPPKINKLAQPVETLRSQLNDPLLTKPRSLPTEYRLPNMTAGYQLVRVRRQSLHFRLDRRDPPATQILTTLKVLTVLGQLHPLTSRVSMNPSAEALAPECCSVSFTQKRA